MHVELNNLIVSAIVLAKKCAGQVKHRKNANECESAIVFGANDNWIRNPTRTGSASRAQSSSSPRKSSRGSIRRAGTAGAFAS
ncbi:hypothetical protein PI125_g24134 [Phytophthora idaei]|nr:hypothetical protein PI125_g24134 [Phytophthora idaei]